MRNARFLLIVLAAAPGAALARQYPSTQPYSGITYQVETREDPPMRLFVATIDLKNPRVHVRVAPGGPDPDGPGEWETTLMQPTRVAAREEMVLVVNGDFYDIPRRSSQSQPAAPDYRPRNWAGVLGAAVSDGEVWSTSKAPRPCLVVRKNRKATIEMIDRPPADAWTVVAGNVMLVEAGKPVALQSKLKHPRTVVGLDKRGEKLVILVVDGRRPGMSVGMSYEELTREMLRLGCHTAINLDGGGSSVMAIRDPKSGDYRILNTPSDGRERAVANVLGISVGERPAPADARH